MLKGQIEIALTTSFPRSPRIVAELFRREKLVLVASRRHPLARAHEVSLRDVQRTPLLIRSSGGRDGTTARRLKVLEEEGIKLTIGMRFESPSAMREAIRRSMGVGVVHKDVARDDLIRGEFKALRIPGLNFESEIYIMYLRDKPLSKDGVQLLKLLRRSRSKESATEKKTVSQTTDSAVSTVMSAFL